MAGYRRRKVKENPERQIIQGLIVSDEYFKAVQHIFRIDLITTPYICTVAKWVSRYYQQFKKAPGIHIEDIFKKEEKEGNIEEDELSLIEDLLSSLSEDYERAEQFNVEYLLDQTEKYLETKNLEFVAKSVSNSLSKNALVDAQRTILNYKSLSIRSEKIVDPLSNSEEMAKAFETSSTPLFRLPGAAGKFLDDLFIPDSFVTLLGPEKRGKTWMLIEMSIAARRAGRNVAFFAAGDMTRAQMLVRYGIRFTGRSNRQKFCKEIKVPCLDCYQNQTGSCEESPSGGKERVIRNSETKEYISWDEDNDYSTCIECFRDEKRFERYQPAAWFKIRDPVKVLEWSEATKQGEIYQRRWGKKAKLLIEAYPNESLTISEIKKKLGIWELEIGFVPDVLIIDYMDLLVPEKGEQFRHQQNSIWAGIRGLSQQRHCLVISASQSDAASYYSKWITMKNFSEDKRKFSHVTGMITMNQLPEEKKRGVMRLGKLAVREDECNENQYVTILQSLAQGRQLTYSY